MGLDIRMPIGLMFTAFGVMLTIFGLASDKKIYLTSLGVNINFVWGLVLLGFGIIMLVLAYFGSAKMKTVPPADAASEPRRDSHGH